jgi:hypothetical protein
MRQICILYKTTNNFVTLSCDNDKMASQIYSQIYNAKLTKKDILLINGSDGYSRFIDPSEILDCYITKTEERNV